MKKIGLSKFVLPLLTALALAFFGAGLLNNLDDGSYRNFVGNVITISVTLLGFLLTLVAIMSTLAERRLIRNMAKTGHLASMYVMFFVAVFGFFATILIVMIIQMVNLPNSRITSGIYLIPFIFSIIVTLRGTHFFFNVVNVLNKSDR